MNQRFFIPAKKLGRSELFHYKGKIQARHRTVNGQHRIEGILEHIDNKVYYCSDQRIDMYRLTRLVISSICLSPWDKLIVLNNLHTLPKYAVDAIIMVLKSERWFMFMFELYNKKAYNLFKRKSKEKWFRLVGLKTTKYEEYVPKDGGQPGGKKHKFWRLGFRKRQHDLPEGYKGQWWWKRGKRVVRRKKRYKNGYVRNQMSKLALKKEGD